MVDLCVYFRKRGGVLVVVGVYVDNLLVTGTRQDAVDASFEELASLSIKNLGRAHKFLGMRVNYDDVNGYRLDQELKIMDMLKEFGMEMAHSVRTLIGEEWSGESESNAELLPAAGSGETPTITKFQSLVGSLLWVARCTRPDIAFAVHKASRRTHCPTIADWKLAIMQAHFEIPVRH
ncbi:hypothetical protein PC121_g20298 [Phytophthora cactorum]|nr:hypothetical protein PC120_g21600 [Phytophthora cactorum]KAG3047043.1 hypothetical protein PC121_g20298 [Phytophthora cactorum]